MDRNVAAKRAHLISATSELLRLARRGRISAARKLFDDMPDRDTVAWNAMLTAYSGCGLPVQALSLFARMRSSSAVPAPTPDPFSFTAALSASADLRELRGGKQHHALLLHLGFHGRLPVCNALIDMYGKCSRPSDAAQLFDEMDERNDVTWCALLRGYLVSGRLPDARRLFGEMPARTTVAWNTLMVGYAQLGLGDSCVELFKEMQMCGFNGDVTTFASLINACSEMKNPSFGLMIHSIALRRGWSVTTEVGNSLLSFYASFNSRGDAQMVFDAMPHRTLISWNAMIDASMKFGDVEQAAALFERAPETNAISWTTMIVGFARNSHGEKALALFADMIRKSLSPDDFTYGAALHACTAMAVLSKGRLIHGCAIRSGFGSYLYVSNCLVNMYSKCGDIICAGKVFHEMRVRDLVSWNAMLFGFATHGWASAAFRVFDNMVISGVSPDKFTFMGLLLACNHAGLIDVGKTVLETMEDVHGLRPDIKHESCVTHMLGRAELQARSSTGVPREMQSTLETLLGTVIDNEEADRDVKYVMLSNFLCANGRWDEAERLRRRMMEEGVKKSPGCSWIEVKDMVVVFMSGRQSTEHLVDVNAVAGF
ncbi:pentatricopeptide repeat-containing protein At2g36980, mitochondrial-like [Curcuma longa]|uniref:pentatricopeptide repeat-containing protein At2g36980, mitochondrial-like n=1 Tax=Curcuma longa TaxID=136217 RepID=UPI003D9E72A9